MLFGDQGFYQFGFANPSSAADYQKFGFVAIESLVEDEMKSYLTAPTSRVIDVIV